MATNTSESTVQTADQRTKHLSTTLQSLASLEGGEGDLRAMYVRWCDADITEETLLTRDAAIASLLQTAAIAGRRIGKMQYDAQQRVSALKGSRTRGANMNE
ncbi:MAG: hypothetical protein Greene041662_353 [Candidatus Peregrinibacteria bacterium Greene0416_62]|nr:MAG: hypothetical protein Greene041662_353 [Candidatus Peregrinibacteria bacterium Greene0416_62]TSC97630.1 MAG: hypothetical protein Greene101449_1135 [Candidatus Peregrinibacteria bacterium Greene1014_49]